MLAEVGGGEGGVPVRPHDQREGGSVPSANGDTEHQDPSEHARYDDGQLVLYGLDSEVPSWVEEYGTTADRVMIVDSSLRTLSWVSSFKWLVELNADSNRIASLAGMDTLPNLQTLSLNMNVITNLNALLVHCVNNFPRLTLLSLLGNPCCPSELIGHTAREYDEYVVRVRAALPTLRFLDHMALQPLVGKRGGSDQVLNPLKEAMENLKSRQFTRACKDLGKVVINAAIMGKELGTDVSFSVSSLAAETTRDFITGAKTALLNAAPSAAAAALSESDQLQILQKQLLPKLLEHDGAAVIAELTGLYATGKIDQDEYRRLLRLNGEMQQETAEINRSNTIRALEEFESYVFPEKNNIPKVLSVSEDGFSKTMRDSGLKHVSFNKVVTRLTHDQLPPELDLSSTSTMLDAAMAECPNETEGLANGDDDGSAAWPAWQDPDTRRMSDPGSPRVDSLGTGRSIIIHATDPNPLCSRRRSVAVETAPPSPMGTSSQSHRAVERELVMPTPSSAEPVGESESPTLPASASSDTTLNTVVPGGWHSDSPTKAQALEDDLGPGVVLFTQEEDLVQTG
eukprot:m.106509 g.106509  ORF g.106509 m.106509 type:complete len:570 (+) comp10590_c1_seq1:259-1968(+)